MQAEYPPAGGRQEEAGIPRPSQPYRSSAALSEPELCSPAQG